MGKVMSLATNFLAFLPILAVIALVNSRIRGKIGKWFAERPARVWLLPLGFVSFYCLMAVLGERWQFEIFLKTAMYFLLPTALVYFTRYRANKAGWPDIILILLFWMPTEFGLLPMHWGNILGISYPAGIWCAVIFIFVIASGVWREIDLYCEWRIRLKDLKLLFFAFSVLFYVIVPPAVQIGFIKFGLNKDVAENWFNILLIVAGIFFVIAITEELLFRGLIQNLIMTRMNFLPGLVTASMIFGLSHLNNGVNAYQFPNWPYVLFATVAGLGYGYIYQKTRSLINAALLHTLVDFTWVIFFKA
jgi:hypothetical protein